MDRIDPQDAPFLGRMHERDVIAHQLKVVERGVVRVVMVSGEPGIGKSRLLSWIAQQGRQRGDLVLRGGASEAEGMPPYLPFLDALGQYIRVTSPEELRRQAGQYASILSTIAPELAVKIGDSNTSYPLPAEQARLRLFEAVSVFLAGIAATTRMMILLDDLQWADTSTLDLLLHIVRSQPTAPLLLAGAYRDSEVEDSAPLRRTLATLLQLRSLTTLRLVPLTPGEVEELASAYLMSSVSSELSNTLYRQSEGNPFFAEELLRGWDDSGALITADGQRGLNTSLDNVMPAGLLTVIRQRLERLDPAMVGTLRIASLIGRTFDLALLAEVVDQDTEETEDHLLAATAAQLVVSEDGEHFSFVHDKIREALSHDLTASRRRRLHGAVGRALEHRMHQPDAHHLAELAFHFTHSGDTDRGVDYSRQAADEALQHAAIDEALTHLQSALALLDHADVQRVDLLLRFADAAVLADREEEAADAYEQSHKLAMEMENPIVAARAMHGLGVARMRQDSLHEALSAFEAALSLLGDHNGKETVRVLVDAASLLAVSMGQQDIGVMHGRRALELAAKLADPRLQASATRAVGNLEVRGNRIWEGLRLLENALAIAIAEDDLAEAAECCACLANACYWVGQIERSRQYTSMRAAFAQKCQQPYEFRHVYSWLAFLAATQGDWTAAEEWLTRAHSVVRSLVSAEPLGFLYQAEGFLAWNQGQFERAEQQFEKAVAIFRDQGNETVVWYLGLLGLAQLENGKDELAKDTLKDLEALVAGLPVGTLPTAPALICGALLVVGLQDRARAEHYDQELRAFSGQLHWFLADSAIGSLSALCGNWSRAEEHLNRAELLARRERMQPVLDWLRREKSQLKKLSSEERVGLPAGLTRREVEVLVLVAAGNSNRDIAHRLFLSENTIAKHLTSIFNKTGSENRAAAAAFALRHGLTQ